MSKLTEQEVQALAMHEIMQREQRKYAERIEEQRKIAMMSDETLYEIVYAPQPLPPEQKERP